MLVLAGPGSGKTFVMIQRVVYLITHYSIPPTSILVISFSKASAQELRERFNKQMGSSKVVHFSTFHACFFHILKTTCHYTAKDIITPREQRDIMKILLSDPGYGESYSKEKAEEYLQHFSYYKNKGLTSMEEKESKQFQALFHAYQEEMHSRRKLDFDDMGLLCLQLFQSRPEILSQWQKKFVYVLIDEFQDINSIQFHLVQLLTEKSQNLFVVGDDDQAIYSFRGASPQIMLNFEKLYPKAKRVLLETNFRCSGNIIKKSLEVIEKNKLRFPKKILAHHEPKAPVCIKAFGSVAEQYGYVAERIKGLLEEQAAPWEIACIYRTNQNMMGLADYFIRHQIPFVMREAADSIFRHFIARDILSYLQFFLEGKKRRDFLAIMNKPLRYLSRNACTSEWIVWKELLNYYESKPYMKRIIQEMMKQERWISRLDLYGAISYIRKVIGYEQYLKELTIRQGSSWEEAQEILNFIHSSTKGTVSLEQWKMEIHDYEESLKQAGEEKAGVHLITMHSCKGLEYPYVFIPDCNEGKIPYKRALTQEEVEEERRMLYVAMTRAKESLEILYLQDKTGKKFRPSRFLPLPRSPKDFFQKKSRK